MTVAVGKETIRSACVLAGLEKFQDYEVFVKSASEWISTKLFYFGYTQKKTGQSGIGKVDFRGFHNPLADVLKMGLKFENDK